MYFSVSPTRKKTNFIKHENSATTDYQNLPGLLKPKTIHFPIV